MIERGGSNEERLYLFDLKFKHKNEEVTVKKTDMPDIENIIQRHKSRYHLPAFYVRKGDRVLDFPCGSGYGYEILSGNSIYEGRDIDTVSIAYARKIYNNSEKVFIEDDLTKTHLKSDYYNVIACIEGIEHIDEEGQINAIKAFYNGLKKGGRLIISTPIKNGETKNKYHKHELTENELLELITQYFDDYEILEMKEILHNGEKQNCMFVICRRG